MRLPPANASITLYDIKEVWKMRCNGGKPIREVIQGGLNEKGKSKIIRFVRQIGIAKTEQKLL